MAGIEPGSLLNHIHHDTVDISAQKHSEHHPYRHNEQWQEAPAPVT